MVNNNGKPFTTIILNGKANYNVRAYTVKEHLKTASLEQFITDIKIKDDQVAKAQEAKSLLLSSLASSEIEKILHCSNTAEIWKHFHSAYGSKTSDLKLEDLNTIRCKSPREVPDAINQALVIQGKLKGLDVSISDLMVTSILVNALPAGKYENFLEAWGMVEEDNRTLTKFGCSWISGTPQNWIKHIYID